MTESVFPIVLSSDDLSASAAVDALALRAFCSGAQPWSTTVELARVRLDATLLPPGSEASRVAIMPFSRVMLAEGRDWTMRISRRGDEATIVVCASNEEVGTTVLARTIDGVCEPPPVVDDRVDVGFWYLDTFPARNVRSVKIESWPTIARNYTASAVRSLEWLMAARPEHLTGRLLLLHGPPGTGKTTAIRALANAWREWCRLECVLDPDQLLGETSYLVDVLERVPQHAPTWRLLLLEDCDEVMRADAKSGAGQAMARLLNLTDGLLGQGMDVVVAISTNEPVSRLHPAVTRPGRCIAQVEVGRLSPAEARAWLGRSVPIAHDGATLAELFALRGDLRAVEEQPDVAAGLYL